MKKIKQLLIFIFVLLMLTACKEQTLKVGEIAPDIAVKNGQGKMVELQDYQGKSVIIDFLSRNCGACFVAIPKLNKLYNENAETLIVIGIAVDISEEELDTFSKAHDIRYPLLADQLNISQERYQIIGYPTLIFLNKQHYLERIEEGITENPNWIANVSAWAKNQN